MKRFVSILLTIALLAGLCTFAAVTVSADGESTADVWDGTANIKWYIDAGADATTYSIQTAEDLAGLAFLVNASLKDHCYDGVYYDAETGVVKGYRLSGKLGSCADTTLVYSPATGDTSAVVDGNSFVWRTFLLENDLILNEGDAADWATTAPANDWQPIGGSCHCTNEQDPGFDGAFDGQGHTITGLYVKDGYDSFASGLFGYAGKNVNTSFKNLTITNFYVEGGYCVGALVGRTNKATEVENVLVSNGYIVSQAQSAALVGAVFGGSISINLCGIDNVEMTSNRFAGMFTGISVGQSIDVTNSYVKGTATAAKEVGVISGRVKGGTISVTNVYSIVKVEATDTTLGKAGLIWAEDGDGSAPQINGIENFYATMDITGVLIHDEDVDGPIEVTEAQLTGDFAKATLQGFDFETIWDVTAEGTPFLNLREAPGSDDGNNDGGNNNGGNNDSGNSGNSGSNTTKPATTEAATTPTTNAPTTTETPSEEKGGCGSAIGFASVAAITMILGSALMIKNKEN